MCGRCSVAPARPMSRGPRRVSWHPDRGGVESDASPVGSQSSQAGEPVPNRLTRTFNAIGGSLMARSGRSGSSARRGEDGTRPQGPHRLRGARGRDDPPGGGQPRESRLDREPQGEPRLHVRDQGQRAPLPGQARRRRGPAGRPGEMVAQMGRVAERADWGDLFVLEPEPRIGLPVPGCRLRGAGPATGRPRAASITVPDLVGHRAAMSRTRYSSAAYTASSTSSIPLARAPRHP